MAKLAAGFVYDFILPRLGTKAESFLDAVPVGAESVRVIIAVVAAPILYLAVFLLVRGLLSIGAWIVEKCVPILKKRSHQAISMPLGAFNGLLIAIVTLVPLCGYLAFGAHLLDTFVDEDLADYKMVEKNVLDRIDMDEDDLEEIMDTVESNPVVLVVHNTIGKPIFKAVTTATLDTSVTHGQKVKINLEQELNGLVESAADILDVVQSFKKADYTTSDKRDLLAAGDALFESDWISLLANDTLVALSETWLANERFVGVKRPTLDKTLNPTIDSFLTVLADETPETLAEDAHLLLDLVGDLFVNDMVKKNANYTAMVRRIGESGLLTDMLAKLEKNERLAVLADELKALSIRLVSNMLGLDDLKSGKYSAMMDEVADALTDSLRMSEAERDNLILREVRGSFADRGYNVPEDVALKMSHEMIDDLGADGEITKEELTDYLVSHADGTFDAIGDAQKP
ncbi:MAG: hypothetical protein J6B24_01005 [Clostridia bacterium]|nr:hypothetical protein [Clostridia bacterium]